MRKLLLAGAAFAALASPAYATDWSNLMKGDGDISYASSVVIYRLANSTHKGLGALPAHHRPRRSGLVEHQSFPDPVTHAFYRNEQTCRHAIFALKRPDPALDPYR